MFQGPYEHSRGIPEEFEGPHEVLGGFMASSRVFMSVHAVQGRSRGASRGCKGYLDVLWMLHEPRGFKGFQRCTFQGRSMLSRGIKRCVMGFQGHYIGCHSGLQERIRAFKELQGRSRGFLWVSMEFQRCSSGFQEVQDRSWRFQGISGDHRISRRCQCVSRAPGVFQGSSGSFRGFKGRPIGFQRHSMLL